MSNRTTPRAAVALYAGGHINPQRAIPALAPIGRSAMAPAHARLLCHSGSRGTLTEGGDDVPARGFLRFLYISDPAWKPLPRFPGEKTSSTALKAIAGCRGGHREGLMSQDCKGHRVPAAPWAAPAASRHAKMICLALESVSCCSPRGTQRSHSHICTVLGGVIGCSRWGGNLR
jgi:hypothetical protein